MHLNFVEWNDDLRTILHTHLAQEEEEKGEDEVGAAGEHAQGEEQRRDQDPRAADHRIRSRVFRLQGERETWNTGSDTIKL